MLTISSPDPYYGDNDASVVRCKIRPFEVTVTKENFAI